MMLGRKKMLCRVKGRAIWVRHFGQQEGAVYLRHREEEAGEGEGVTTKPALPMYTLADVSSKRKPMAKFKALKV